ncbi:hypothetical protein GCM10028807_32660 [Spirosoma daeguense]
MTATMWPRRNEFDRFIGDIPPTFRFEKLEPILTQIYEGWLTDLLTPTQFVYWNGFFADGRFTIYDQPDGYPGGLLLFSDLTERDYDTGRVLLQFLTYAAWSAYILRDGAQVTDTGIVTKLNQDSDPISDRRRTEISLQYKTLAERKAVELSRLLKEPDVCSPSLGYSGRPVIQKAQRRSPSRLGN